MSLMEVRHVGKAFREYSSELRRIGRWFGLSAEPVSEFWALRDVHFTVNAGEAIGIVGQNGAGKSTLLKILTGTLTPTTGSVQLGGRIAAILELGMGFNPELSGRQNVYHAAGLMGFSEGDIEEMIDGIEEFAEVGSYFDEPMRTCSSGMQMRVAFAVATAWRPEILIIDEALAVGDAYFQHKSIARIREYQGKGTTMLIVSHDRTSIQALCGRAILLEDGVIVKDGQPEEVMDFYNAIIARKGNSTISTRRSGNGRIQTRSGTGDARIVQARLINANHDAVEAVNVGEVVSLVVEVAIQRDLPQLVLGYLIKDRLGQPVFGTNTYHLNQALTAVKAGASYRYEFSFPASMGVGSYSIALALHGGAAHVEENYEWVDMAIVFNVFNLNREQFIGVSWMPPVTRCTS